MKIIIAPDKFKGSLTSAEVCNAISEGILSVMKEKPLLLHFPMADGGDGFNMVLQHYFQTETITVDTVDPLNRPIKASFQWNGRTKLAVIEMATASGLVLLKQEEKNPLQTSTFGTGILIQHAIGLGAKKIILGLGGSATTDAGIGILAALGFTFTDENGKALEPVGGSLSLIHSIIPPQEQLPVFFEIAADVENPLFGTKGAAYVYGPQKGADPDMVEVLDQGLRHFAELIERQFFKQIASFPGAGAAGGIAAGIAAFFDVEMKKGVELVLQANNLEQELSNASLIITGEGRIDDQSGSGKVVGRMAALAKKYNLPCIAFCGLFDAGDEEIAALGLKAVYPIADPAKSSEENMKNAYGLLFEKAVNVFK